MNHRLSFPALLSFTVAALGQPAGASQTIVRAFALPPGFTVKAESQVRAINIAHNGVVTALAGFRGSDPIRVFRWSPSGARTTFQPLNVTTQPDPDSPGQRGVFSVATTSRSVFVTVTAAWSGAYMGLSADVQQWEPSTVSHWRLPKCVVSGDAFDQYIYGADDAGRLALTMDMTGKGSFLVIRDDNAQYAPYAFVVDRSKCRVLGRGTVVGVRGQWSSGYRGYLNGHVAPTGQETSTVAVRWHGVHIVELGPGDALAVTSNGFAAGADAVHAHIGAPPVPHAVAWDQRGRRISIDADDRSVAYDVSDDETVVGTLLASDGVYHAFRWRSGKRELLDDLPHPPGWKFASAYAIRADGTIVGIGTHDRTPTVFVWHA